MKIHTFNAKIGFVLGLFLLVFLSCSGSGSGSEEPLIPTPSNLSVTATIVGADAQNPAGDGSGKVNFKINATNATSYKLLIEGKVIDVTTTDYAYVFKTVGTNSYTILASTYNGAQYINTSISVTVKVESKLVWSDEFNVNGAPDPSKWNTQVWDPGHVNNELQSYTNRSKNLIVENGVLKVMAYREDYGKGKFTSGRIESNGKFEFTYGTIVIRAKVPVGVGTWPAVWMLGANIGTVGWPACGEIDILESVGKNLDQNHSSLHSPGRSGATPDTGIIKVPNSSTEFHIYKANWSASEIKFYVDDVLFYTFQNSDKFPFNKNFYLIVNLAMGGVWGGDVDPNFTSSTFEIDYIRVYN